MPIKLRRVKLAFIQVCYLALAGLSAIVIQATLIAPQKVTPPPLQSGGNHYLLALEQVEGLSPQRTSPFWSADPFRIKPKTDKTLILKIIPNLPKFWR